MKLRFGLRRFLTQVLVLIFFTASLAGLIADNVGTEEKVVTVRGGSKLFVLFESTDKLTFKITAKADTENDWAMLSADVSNTMLWRAYYGRTVSEAMSNAAYQDLTELFAVTLYGDIARPGPGPGPVPTYEVVGEHKLGIKVIPVVQYTGVGQAVSFQSLGGSDSEPVDCNWTVKSEDGSTTLNSTSPTSQYSVTLSEPGYYSVTAVKPESTANATAALTVIKVEISRVQTTSPVFNATTTISLCENPYPDFLNSLFQLEMKLQSLKDNIKPPEGYSEEEIYEILLEILNYVNNDLQNSIKPISFSVSGSYTATAPLLKWNIEVLPHEETVNVYISTAVKKWTTTRSFGDWIAEGLPGNVMATSVTQVTAKSSLNGGTQEVEFSHEYGEPYEDSVCIDVPAIYTEEYHLDIMEKATNKNAAAIKSALNTAKQRLKAIKRFSDTVSKGRYSPRYTDLITKICNEIINQSTDIIEVQIRNQAKKDWQTFANKCLDQLEMIEKKLPQRKPAGGEDTRENISNMGKYVLNKINLFLK